ncbi:MAG: endonuclease III [Candidatus Eremiobacteraeota bacterium]|nr:endonuclease III [Candidatus Eremiobacteraeota bacterium]
MAARPAQRSRTRRTRRTEPPKNARRPTLTKSQRDAAILDRLRKAYAGAETALEFEDTFQLLIAVILSAQCTDARVNMVTPALFARYPTPEALAAAEPEEVEPYIKTCGLFTTKAKNIVNASRRIVQQHSGTVPNTMEELLELPGVGRKTANVVLSVGFQQAAIAVDTHVFRVANRTGLTRAKTPAQSERQLMRVVPKRWWSRAHHWLIHHGREVCHARRPACATCVLVDLCPSAKRFLTLSGGS